VPPPGRIDAAPMRRSVTAITVAVTAGVLSLSGCSTDQSPVCDSLEAVETSLAHIRTATVGENGLSQLQADLTTMKTNLSQLAADARAQFAPQVAAVRSTVNQLSTSAAAAKSDPDAGNLGAVGDAVSALRSSVHELRDAMSATC
jgi:uncharacterized phage infection (PIP) family protein YhgE